VGDARIGCCHQGLWHVRRIERRGLLEAPKPPEL